jgi:hypothetical protein
MWGKIQKQTANHDLNMENDDLNWRQHVNNVQNILCSKCSRRRRRDNFNEINTMQ